MADLTTKEVAEQLETTPRTLRRFLRAEAKAAGGTIGEDTPGRGGRYSFESDDVEDVRERFSAYLAAQAAKQAEREAAEDEDDEELEDV